jgi:predicted RNA-binding protein YlxR (DUF448 family)
MRKRAKAELVRVARRPGGSLVVDPESLEPGRGAYVCPDPECVGKALATGRLRRALRLREELPEGLGKELSDVAERRLANARDR